MKNIKNLKFKKSVFTLALGSTILSSALTGCGKTSNGSIEKDSESQYESAYEIGYEKGTDDGQFKSQTMEWTSNVYYNNTTEEYIDVIKGSAADQVLANDSNYTFVKEITNMASIENETENSKQKTK